jgi:uncharacterized membrane protein
MAMAHAESTIIIEKPVGVVYSFLLDGINNPLWRPSVTDIRLLPNKSAGAIAAYKQGLQGPGGRRIDGDYDIVDALQDQLIRFQVTAGPPRPTGTYKLEALGSSTSLTFILHYEPKGLAKLMDTVITKTMQQEVATLTNLKTYLESH